MTAIIQPDKLAAVNRHLNLMRNKDKRDYGFAYVAWLKGGGVGDPPERGRLSYMAAQAVRLDISERNLWDGAEIA